MRLTACLWLVLPLVLSGCYSTSQVPSPLRPAKNSDQVGYLVGSLGNSSNIGNTPSEQQIMFRMRGGVHKAWVRMMDSFLLHTPAPITEPEGGKAGVFVMPLKPGEYELYNVQFSFGGSATVWKKEDISIPLTVEAGKAYYLGDFRSVCFKRSSLYRINQVCSLLRSNQLSRDRALINSTYPQLPELQWTELEQLHTAFPLILNGNDPEQALKSLMEGK